MTDDTHHNHANTKRDTRRAYYPDELPEHLKKELEKDFCGEATPKLNHLINEED